MLANSCSEWPDVSSSCSSSSTQSEGRVAGCAKLAMEIKTQQLGIGTTYFCRSQETRRRSSHSLAPLFLCTYTLYFVQLATLSTSQTFCSTFHLQRKWAGLVVMC